MKYGVSSLVVCIFTLLWLVKIQMLTREITHHIHADHVIKSYTVYMTQRAIWGDDDIIGPTEERKILKPRMEYIFPCIA